jgi:hypothetical protein
MSHFANIIQEDVNTTFRHFVNFRRNCQLFSLPNMHSISLNSNWFGAASKSARQSQDDLGSSMGTTILLVICSISSRLYFQSQMKHVCGYKSFAKIMHMNP